MKKVLTVAAAAGLMSLAAACTPAATNNTAADVGNEVEANAAIYADDANITVENATVIADNVVVANEAGNAM